MIEKITKHLLSALMIAVCLTIAGCGVKGISGKKTMEIPASGVSIKIPAGWVRDDSHMCHKGEFNTGMLIEEPLEGKNFEETATKISKEFGAEIISTGNLKINDYKAIKTHIKLPNGVNALRVYIHKKDKIITASFAIESKKMYEKYKPALLKSMKTIKVK